MLVAAIARQVLSINEATYGLGSRGYGGQATYIQGIIRNIYGSKGQYQGGSNGRFSSRRWRIGGCSTGAQGITVNDSGL